MAGRKLKRVAIYIPIPLFERISSRARKTGFSNESDYSTYILREAINGVEEREKNEGKIPSREASKVFEKLRALGYI